MKKQSFFIILIILVSSLTKLSAQENLWKTHFSYETDVTSIARGADLVYAVSDGKLFGYSPASGAYNAFVKDEHNSDVTHIVYNSKTNGLLIVREDFDIDVLVGNTFFNIPALKNTSQNINKTINEVFMHEDFAYLSTGFGVLVVDMKNKEIKETCLFGYPVYSLTFYDNKFYIATSKGVRTIGLDKNMQDDKNWDVFTLSDKYNSESPAIYKFVDTNVRNLLVYRGTLHFLVPSLAVYLLEGDVVDRVVGNQPLSLVLRNDMLVAYKATAFWYFVDIKRFRQVTATNMKLMVPDNEENQFWVARSGSHLELIKTNNLTQTTLLKDLKPQGPLMNNIFSVSYTGGKIRAVRGGYNRDRLNKVGQLSELDNGSWFNYPIPTGAKDFASVVADPLEPDNLFVPSWGEGIYEYKNKKYSKTYNDTNSSLLDIFSGKTYIRVNGIAFDKDNRFWITNTMVKNGIHVFEKTGATWTSRPLYFSEIDNDVSIINHILIDRNGNKWVSAMGKKPYLFIFNENGTIADPSDDKTKYLEIFYDQAGQRVPESDIYSAVEDLNGNIWIATTSGLYIVYKSDDVFSGDIVFNKIEIAKNDGTAFTEYFLQNAVVKQMVVDKANRKWIATDAFGVYLLSADGQTVIHNFTAANSPLPSDRVQSVTIDDLTGDVYFGTEKGLVSFSAGVVSGADKESTIYSYPNPVSSDYVGNITIKGCEFNSLIKIVDENNDVVSQGVALKGEYKWDMTTQRGATAGAGVYLVFGTDENGKLGLLTQIRVTN